MSDKKPDADQDVSAIRDILFGQQMRSYDQRFQGLEAALEKQVRALRDDLSEQLQKLTDLVQSDRQALEKAQELEANNVSAQLQDLQQTVESVRAELISSTTDQIESLRDASVSRRDLATMLHELADRLAGN